MGCSEMSGFARGVVERLRLERHPEGGWYRRTWESGIALGKRQGEDESLDERPSSGRPIASLIYFLLPAGDASAWHVLDADELWLWHGPGRVTLMLGGAGDRPDEDGAVQVALGVSADCPEQARAQAVVPAGTWQRTLPQGEDALVSCVVSPGFTYEGFALA